MRIISGVPSRLVPVANVGLVTIGVVVVGVAALQFAPRPAPHELASNSQTVTGTGTCDVTGVHVAYDTDWQAAPAAGVVTTATVDSIEQPSCHGATLKVILRHTAPSAAPTELGTATAVVGTATTQSVVFSPAVPAAEVNDVFVQLDGGATPVPDECSGMKLDNVLLGTTDSDTITDTKGSTLIYGLGGNDTISSGNKADCIVVQDGNNTVSGSSGDDVVLAGNGTNAVQTSSGSDLIKVGNGNSNHIDAGPGDDTIYIGSGVNNVVDGGTGNKNVCHVPFPVSQVSAHGDMISNCKVVTP